jgi:hypothetical protein
MKRAETNMDRLSCAIKADPFDDTRLLELRIRAALGERFTAAVQDEVLVSELRQLAIGFASRPQDRNPCLAARGPQCFPRSDEPDTGLPEAIWLTNDRPPSVQEIQSSVADQHALFDGRQNWQETADQFSEIARRMVAATELAPLALGRQGTNPLLATRSTITINLDGSSTKSQVLAVIGECLQLGAPAGHGRSPAGNSLGWGMNWDALFDCLLNLHCGGIWGTSPVFGFPLKLEFVGADAFAREEADSFAVLQDILEQARDTYARIGMDLAFDIRL